MADNAGQSPEDGNGGAVKNSKAADSEKKSSVGGEEIIAVQDIVGISKTSGPPWPRLNEKRHEEGTE